MATAVGLPFPQLSRGRFAYRIPNHVVPDFATGILDGEIIAYTDEALFAACGVRVVFTERTGGISVGAFSSLNLKVEVGDDARIVGRNRAALCDALGAPDLPLIVPNQVHGTRILETNSAACIDVSRANEWASRGCDGVVVGCSGLGALLCYADCLPLVLVAPTGAFAVVHCGWRGTVAHVAARAFERLIDEARCASDQVNAYIGPYIHVECFEVSDDVAQVFSDEFCARAVSYPTFGEGTKPHVDLGFAVRRDLLTAGVDDHRICDVGLCTSCHTDLFFSYRASGGLCGRHGAFAFRLDDADST